MPDIFGLSFDWPDFSAAWEQLKEAVTSTEHWPICLAFSLVAEIGLILLFGYWSGKFGDPMMGHAVSIPLWQQLSAYVLSPFATWFVVNRQMNKE